jgi:hypothetical protein
MRTINNQETYRRPEVANLKDKRIQFFATKYLDRDLWRNITPVVRVFERLREIYPAKVEFWYRNFCKTDYHCSPLYKIAEDDLESLEELEQGYFSDRVADDYLSEFLSTIRTGGVASLNSLSDICFSLGCIALCQVTVDRVWTLRTCLGTIDHDPMMPHTLVFARIMSHPDPYPDRARLDSCYAG